MKIDIQTIGNPTSPDLRRFVERCAEAAFGVHRQRIESLWIRLTDVDEARGGKNKSCLVEVGLPGRYRIIAEVMDADLEVSIHRALDRAAWTAARRLQRQRRESGWSTIVERHYIGYPPHRAA